MFTHAQGRALLENIMYKIMLLLDGVLDQIDAADTYGEAVALQAAHELDLPERASVYIDE